MENKEKRENLTLLFFLLLFVLIRLFSSSPYFFISMDEGKYLKLAQNLPSYILFNNNFYISHPPLYPLMLKIFGFAMPDHTAGLLLSHLSAIGFILLGVFLLRRLKTKESVIYAAVAFLSVSHLLYYWTNMIYKEVFFTFLAYLFIFTFAASLLTGGKRFMIAASIAGFLLGVTSDLAIFLFPVAACIILLYGREHLRQKKYGALFFPAVFMAAGYGIWIVGRWWIYANNVYYPAGVDGLIEKVADYRLLHLLTPRSFPGTKELTQAGLSLNPKHYIKYMGAFFNMLPPFHVSSSSVGKKDVFLFLVIYAPLAAFLFSGIISSLKSKEKAGYLMLAIMLSFSASIIFEISDPRFSLPALLPAAYFLGKGLMRNKKIAGALSLLLPVFLGGFAVFWLWTNPCFFGSLQKVAELQKTGEFINALPKDGVMAQFGYPPEIAYLTDKRLICLPLRTGDFEEQIEMYGINYVVCGTEETYNDEVIKYIKSDTHRFVNIKIVDEEYPPVNKNEKVYVFEIKR
ncbi:MAG: hypothetical protein JW957_05965 [Candidatus Omnitrophica bacterium]|nr:hypothetical protein [Candidatus Omnitrophota bacterium]